MKATIRGRERGVHKIPAALAEGVLAVAGPEVAEWVDAEAGMAEKAMNSGRRCGNS
jgi:hypothetical protein